MRSLSDAALILLGHGSSQGPGAGAVVYQHAAALRRMNCFAEVREAFWKQGPKIQEVLAAVTVQRIFIVPLFMSEGYFSGEVIPRELGFHSTGGKSSRSFQCGPQTIFYARPVGTHERMTTIVLARASEAVGAVSVRDIAAPHASTLFIAGHGTEQNQNSREAVQRQVELVRAKGLYSGVHAAFLDEAPRIDKCYEIARSGNLIVVPFFIGEGMHTQQDIPVLLGETKEVVCERIEHGRPPWNNPTERNGKLVWYSAAVGTHPEIAHIVMERVREVEESA